MPAVQRNTVVASNMMPSVRRARVAGFSVGGEAIVEKKEERYAGWRFAGCLVEVGGQMESLSREWRVSLLRLDSGRDARGGLYDGTCWAY